jgi:hypothetical protein
VITSAECHERAKEAFGLARMAQTQEQKNALYSMGRAWETLSRHAAEYEKAIKEHRDEWVS